MKVQGLGGVGVYSSGCLIKLFGTPLPPSMDSEVLSPLMQETETILAGCSGAFF